MKDRFAELAEIWIKKANNDYLWAVDSFKDGHFGGTCFLCQQIAEKSLKAFLFIKKEKLARTHNLEQLLKACQKHDFGFEKLSLAGKRLNEYYTDTRYPDIWDYARFEDKNLAMVALKSAKEILEFVGKKLKEEK